MLSVDPFAAVSAVFPKTPVPSNTKFLNVAVMPLAKVKKLFEAVVCFRMSF
ncbi:hypothetical protein SDC9_208094 [bioreactor metagenome]|uniref:Uncharacterized protein n=1 Tax=bioreactor metagenome TaxID=1076179 RepID=A0A645JAB1_9ZZZZ